MTSLPQCQVMTSSSLDRGSCQIRAIQLASLSPSMRIVGIRQRQRLFFVYFRVDLFVWLLSRLWLLPCQKHVLFVSFTFFTSLFRFVFLRSFLVVQTCINLCQMIPKQMVSQSIQLLSIAVKQRFVQNNSVQADLLTRGQLDTSLSHDVDWIFHFFFETLKQSLEKTLSLSATLYIT